MGNSFQLTTILYFKSGNSKRVDWIEYNVKKRSVVDDKIVELPIDSLLEVETYFANKLKSWVENKTTIVKNNIKGEWSIMYFGEVEYATISVSALDKQNHEIGTNNIAVVDIKDHPAYRRPLN